MKQQSLALAILLAGTAAQAQAAPHDATLTCVSGGSTLTLDVTAYDLGITAPVNLGSGSSGAGSGKIVFKPLDVHTSVANFDAVYQPMIAGHSFPTCTLTTLEKGETLTFTLKLVAITGLDLIQESLHAEGGRHPAYLDVNIEYGALQFNQVPGG